MYQDHQVNHLEKRLSAKKNQQAHFQRVVGHYNYALTLLNSEIDRLTKALSGESVKKKWFCENEWDMAILNIIANAGCPLTKEQIEAALIDSNLIPDTTSNPKQYIYQKILHAQKREVIEKYTVPGIRKLYYCIPSWLDESGRLTFEG